MADEYHLKAYGPQYHPLRNQCRAIAGTYIEEIRKTRHNIYSQLIEDKNTSSKWVSEQQAYSIVKSVYADAVYQYQSEWLGKQSLDIYIPSIKVGIEYQGLQHYKALEYFGGIQELEKRKLLDENKRRKCKENNVILVEWKYYEPLTSEFITQAINNAIEKSYHVLI